MTQLHIATIGAQSAAALYNSIAEAFELAAKIADARGEQYRAFAYRRAIVAPETAGRDLKGKMAEFRETGHIRQLDELLAQPETRAFLELDKILGFGPATIRSLIANGIMSREMLQEAARRRQVELTPVQSIGLQYFDDLQRKIPRDDVSRVSEIIFTEIFHVAAEVFDESSARQLIVETTGSYRRHAPESSDIDILITSPSRSHKSRARTSTGNDPRRSFLHQLHRHLARGPNFVHLVSLGSQKYSLLFRFRWVISIDIIYIPFESYYAALLYFTGSQSFNIWMREAFKKRGFSLNQYGLTDPNGKLIILESEQQAFDILGIPYVSPINRARRPP